MGVLNKLANNRGETLIETLVSIILVSLAMLLLSGAIMTTARMNRSSNEATVFLTQSAVQDDSKEYFAKLEGTPVKVKPFNQDGRLYYYETVS